MSGTGWRATVKASPEAMDLLAKLPHIMTRGPTLQNALKAGAAIVLEKAKQLTPRGDPSHNPGFKALVDTEAVVVRRYETTVLAVIGPQYPAGAHGHLVEYGTKAHAITTTKKRGLSTEVPGGRVYFGKSVSHRGSKLHQFLQPAIDATATQVDEIITRVIGEEIERQISGN